MASNDLIDAQFDRAVEIVQGLPKTGPVQTDYEEKLTMYSLYKQATVGNVKSPRPGIWDMLGRAKWDAWSKHKDLDSYEAKWLYVDALLKVLRRYSDKTVAMKLVQEIESYGGDPSNLVMSRSLQSRNSDSSASTVSEGSIHNYPHPVPSLQRQIEPETHIAESENSEEDSADEAGELPSVNIAYSQDNRPQSSLSTNRYRTPIAGSLAFSPPPSHVPATQPLPVFETPSAFADPHTISAQLSSYPGTNAYGARPESSTSAHLYSSHLNHRAQMQSHPSQFALGRPASRLSVERAVESMQAHLAALTERLGDMEARSNLARSHTSWSPRGIGSPGRLPGRGSPNGSQGNSRWDIDDLGMWSLILNPISRAIDFLRDLATFFARNENRSPAMIILRRLCLDVSFLVFVVAVIGALWRKSGVRRREVKAALKILWRAILGTKSERPMIDRGV